MSGTFTSLFLFLLISLGCIFSSRAGIPPEQYRFSILNSSHGLTHNQVSCFFQDDNGYIWIGTTAGLNRFDGHHLKVFTHEAQDSASLSGRDVFNIFQDPEGIIWVSTSQGYNLYHPQTESFTHNWQEQLKKFSNVESGLNEIVKDRSGLYWFIHNTNGLSCYDPETKLTRHFTQKAPGGSGLHSNSVSAISQNVNGDYWILHRDGMLEKLDGKSLKITEQQDYLFRKFNGQSYNYKLTVDSDNDLWLYLPNDQQGVFYFSDAGKTFTHFHKNADRLKLNTNLVTGVVEEEKGTIWIGTDLGGINIIDKSNFTVNYVLHNAEVKNSLVHNSIYSLYKDSDGIIWAGAYKNGVSYYHKNIFRFKNYKHYASLPESLPYNDVNCFIEDEEGNIWIGSNGGGLIHWNRTSGRFTQYKHDPDNPNSLSSDVIVSLETGNNNDLWIGTWLGGLNKFDGRNFTRYKSSPQEDSSLPNENIWEIFEDRKGNLWLGTISQGLQVLDSRNKTFSTYKPKTSQDSVSNLYISAITEDNEGNIWAGGNNGIDVINPETGKIRHFLHDSKRPESLGSNTVLWILKDSKGQMWTGTDNGLDLYQPRDNSFRHFSLKEGLPHKIILAVLEDEAGNIWLSTPNGLSRLQLNYSEGEMIAGVTNYDESDGLQGRVFNENAALKTGSGDLIFGGPNGFNVFNPKNLEPNREKPEIVFTDFLLFNKSTGTGKEVNGRVLLAQSISQTDKITLKHYENVFTLEFAALSFFRPDKHKYLYKLEGFDKEWLSADNFNRRITYTNLDPGDYTFKVRASNNDGLWNDEAKSIQITVLAPFWKTPMAYLFYAMFLAACLLLGRRIMLQRERMKFQLEQQKREARQLHELDLMKIRFFTNISHEFRTPLSLILAPVEGLLSKTQDSQQLRQFQMIHRNAKRLLNLVNQLLDFRKLEVEGIAFYPSEGNIIRFIKESVQSFSDLSENKNIKLSFRSDVAELQASFDMDKLEKILFNLLSNAFKFTPEHGIIEVNVLYNPEAVSSEGFKLLEIQVKDCGIGIPKDKQKKIFKRFFRNEVPDSLVNQGSGIGLSITKEFVKIHGGTISVESEPGKGSCFKVCLPVKELAGSLKTGDFPEAETPFEKETFEKNHLPLPRHNGRKSTILLAEDNEDFRLYLKDNLSEYYTIVEAKNGKEGWQKALSVMPDIIVSDVMMPEMNGIDFCVKVKKDARTSQIPFVLLTAYTAEEQKLKALNTGANDYVTKPFNFKILHSRINNLIQQRTLFQQVYEKKIGVQTTRVEIVSQDDKLIQDAIRITEENIADPDFSVELLSRELGISRAGLYKKLLSITGQSPVEFIRKIRIKRAAQYLEDGGITVAEVAYKVGFNNARYFSKYFKEEYNVLPSQFPEKTKKDSEPKEQTI